MTFAAYDLLQVFAIATKDRVTQRARWGQGREDGGYNNVTFYLLWPDVLWETGNG